MADQLVGRRPGLLVGLAHDDVQPDAEAELAAASRRQRSRHASIFSATCAGGSPQVRYLSIVLGRDRDAGVRRAAEIERRSRRAAPAGTAAGRPRSRCACRGSSTVSPASSSRVDVEELARHLVALVVREEDAVALVLDRIAAGDDVDEQAAVRDAVERRGHARRDASATAGPAAPRRGSAAARSAARAPRRRPRNPRSCGRSAAARRSSRGRRPPARSAADSRDRPARPPIAGAEIAAVAVGRQEPEDIGVRRSCDAHDPVFLTMRRRC